MNRYVMILVLCAAPMLGAQAPDSAPPPIRDNSFLVEEAYNQEAGVVQHVSTFNRRPGSAEWNYAFTQEWPLFSQRHQLSLTVPVHRTAQALGVPAQAGIGDVAVNYRLQLPLGTTRTAIAPRLSVVLPTGSSDDGHGTGSAGMQANLPVSIDLSNRIVSHSNAGLAYTPSARSGDAATGEDESRLTTVSASQSLVWLMSSRVNLLVEGTWARTAVTTSGVTVHSSEVLLAPAVRWAHDIGGVQVVPGVAWVLGVGPSRGERSLLLYLSIEHPF